MYTVIGEGMPVYRDPTEHGNLIVKFDIQFPESNWITNDKLKVSEERSFW